MHSAHQAFASRPSFCSLADLFVLLDEIDARDRHFMLGPLYQQVFRTTTAMIAPGMTEDEAISMVYDRFKEQINSFLATVSSALLVTGIVTTTLVWLHGSSDDSLIDDFIESNQRDLQTHQKQLESGEITEQQFDRLRGEIEERLNNLRSDMALRRAHYEQFCEKVVARIVERR